MVLLQGAAGPNLFTTFLTTTFAGVSSLISSTAYLWPSVYASLLVVGDESLAFLIAAFSSRSCSTSCSAAAALIAAWMLGLFLWYLMFE